MLGSESQPWNALAPVREGKSSSATSPVRPGLPLRKGDLGNDDDHGCNVELAHRIGRRSSLPIQPNEWATRFRLTEQNWGQGLADGAFLDAAAPTRVAG